MGYELNDALANHYLEAMESNSDLLQALLGDIAYDTPKQDGVSRSDLFK